MADFFGETYQHAPGKYVALLTNGKVKKKVLKEGSGDYRPRRGDIVYLHYEARDRKTGKLYFSTIEHGEVAIITLDDFSRKNLKVFDLGVPTMKNGEIARYIVKPEYAYTLEGNPKFPKVPPNRQVIFEVELIRWDFGDEFLWDRAKTVTRSVLRQGNIEERSPWPRERLTEMIPIVNVTIKGWTDKDGRLGRKFMEKTLEFELGYAHEHELPLAINDVLTRFHTGEKALVNLVGISAYPEGHLEFDIEPGAPVKFEITMNRHWVIDPPNYDDLEVRLQDSQVYKDKAAAFFNGGYFEKALHHYNYVVEMLHTKKERLFLKGQKQKTPGPIMRDQTPFNEPYDDRTDLVPPEQWPDRYYEDRLELLTACALNCALCCVKIRDERHAKKGLDYANMILDDQPGHVKALYRRAQNHEVVKEFDKAFMDYRQILNFEPHNRAAKISLRKIKAMEGVLDEIAEKYGIVRSASNFSLWASSESLTTMTGATSVSSFYAW